MYHVPQTMPAPRPPMPRPQYQPPAGTPPPSPTPYAQTLFPVAPMMVGPAPKAPQAPPPPPRELSSPMPTLLPLSHKCQAFLAPLKQKLGTVSLAKVVGSASQDAAAEEACETPDTLTTEPPSSAQPFLKLPAEALSCSDGCEQAWQAPCCVCCDPLCGPPGKIWARGEYLLWWLKGSPLPPLVTLSVDGTPREEAGVLGQPGTRVLFGNERVNDDERSGGRFTIGGWLDKRQKFGLEGSFFFLENGSANFLANSPGSPILARPFFNTQLNQQDSQLVSFPDLLSGAVSVRANTANFLGAGALFRANICRGCCYRVDVLGGYRFLQLDEEIDIDESLTVTTVNPIIPVGTRFLVADGFNTDNQFHGGDLGIAIELRRGRWFLDLTGKCALGATVSTAEVQGNTLVILPDGTQTANVGGLLGQNSNIGRYHRNHFAVVPEVNVNVGVQATKHLRAFAGYTFLYWSDVARAGDQIDLRVNPTQIPPGTLVGPAEPRFEFRSSDFWAQGFSGGLEFRY